MMSCLTAVLHCVDSVDGHYVTADGKRALNLASGNFLGLGNTPEAIVSVGGVGNVWRFNPVMISGFGNGKDSNKSVRAFNILSKGNVMAGPQLFVQGPPARYWLFAGGRQQYD